ncbi:uncharacterized protein LOC113305892 [Papaver somniferum]|uniref:uncharacterized protein LOC113305892 n=1 Tax=Papaver somniferum TaxID=3469 RepID=UPI000E7051BD|nr:uncharacterized protein LOC113305892 [Papaver somniferum]
MAAQNYHTILSQKERVNWIKFGNANTEFFHTQIKLRQAKNNIAKLEDTSAIPDIVNSEDNKILEKIPSQEEIKEAVFCLNQDGAPGPDGYAGIFYREAWNIIKEDLTNVIQFCWSNQLIPSGLNSNFLILLPKIQGAKKASQFRPIGLSNFCFKIFTKIPTIRMSNLIQKIIYPQQCAFIKGRNIHEQVLLASELVNEMNTNIKGGNVALKLNISQTYGTVSWDYLIAVLKKYGRELQIGFWCF